MATIINNIETFVKQRSVLSNLIVINILVFLLIKITDVFCMLFNIDQGFLLYWLELPADFDQMIIKPWTLLTYTVIHANVLHILFNLLWLYWFGKMFLQFFNPRQLGGLYVLGGLTGGILFMLSYNLFPYFKGDISYSYLIGASASVMAIVFATAFYKKDFEVNLLFLGSVKIFYLAIICLVLDLLAIRSSNAGGHIAHIGGALTGIWYAGSIKKGRDITRWINSIIDAVSNLFKKKPAKMKIKHKRPETDYEYNERRNANSREIDRILDKIKRSGYSSLSTEEKKKLFDASKQ